MKSDPPLPAYAIVPSNRYARDLKKLAKSNADLTKLESAIDLLASGETLPSRYRDHGLKGRLAGIRECHIGPDWLLLYRKDKEQLLLLLLRTGSHRDTLGLE